MPYSEFDKFNQCFKQRMLNIVNNDTLKSIM